MQSNYAFETPTRTLLRFPVMTDRATTGSTDAQNTTREQYFLCLYSALILS